MYVCAARAGTLSHTHTHTLYNFGNHILISTSESEGKFTDYIKDTAVACVLVDQLSKKY